MIYNQVLESKELELRSIYLDPNNPRFSEDASIVVPDERIIEEEVQKKAFQNLLANYDVEPLALVIERNGFLKIHRIVVREITTFPGSYVVVEGNRRISACRFLYRQHLDGKVFPEEISNSFLKIEALIYKGDDHTISWEIQGINHLTGIKDWSPFNQAYHLVRKLEEGHSLGNVARQFGKPVTQAAKMVRAYYGLKQLKEDDEFGARAKNSHFSYFEEAFGKPDVKAWLGWDEATKKFTNEINTSKFYRWFLPESGEERKLPMAINVRKLPPIITDPIILNRFDTDLSLEDALRELGRSETGRDYQDVLRTIDIAKNTINGITAANLREHGSEIDALLAELIRIANDVRTRCQSQS